MMIRVHVMMMETVSFTPPNLPPTVQVVFPTSGYLILALVEFLPPRAQGPVATSLKQYVT